MTDSSSSAVGSRNEPLPFIHRDKKKDPTTYHFLATHKTGSLLTEGYRRKWFHYSSFWWRIFPSVDKKTVIVVRDLFDATVSGYLYHKTGNECWLNGHGEPNSQAKHKNAGMKKNKWSKNVNTVPVPDSITYPKYDICRALEAVDEKIGIGIYLEWARNEFYAPIYPLSKQIDPPTLSVCMEDMVNYPEATAERIYNFYIFNNTERYLQKPTTNQRRLASDAGGHATDSDPVLRKRLYDLAKEVDCEYFNCTTQMWNDQAVRCTSSINTISSVDTASSVNASSVNASSIIKTPSHDQIIFEIEGSFQAQEILSVLGLLVIYFVLTRRFRCKSQQEQPSRRTTRRARFGVRK